MKKLLAVLLAVTIVLGCVPAFASTGPAIERAEIMSAGQEIDETVWGTVVSGYADIVVTKNSNISVFIASYDRLGRLLDIKSQTTNVNSLEATVYSPELLLDDDSAKVKLFVLDGLMPLGEAKEIPVINSRNKLTVDADDVFSATVENDYIEFSYFESEEARRATPVTVSSNAKLYIVYIGYAGSAAEIVSYIHDGRYPYFYGHITLLNVNNRAEDYDTIVIEDYSTIVVDENNTDTYRITAKNPEVTLSYDPEYTYLYAYLFDTNGNKLNFEDVKENDVISYKEYQSGFNEVIVATKLESKTVTGHVDTLDNGLTIKCKINDVWYSANPLYITDGDIAFNDTVTLYFDAFGKIAYAELYVPPANYAYIVDISDNVSAIDPRIELKVYTSNGEFTTMPFASKVKVDGVSNIPWKNLWADENYDNANDNNQIAVNESADMLSVKQGTDWYVINGDQITGVVAINPGQVITYMVDGLGYITSIDRPSTQFSLANSEGKFTEYTNAAGTLEYNGTRGAFDTNSGRLYPTENTKIMVAPTMDASGTLCNDPWDLTEEDFKLSDSSNLTDGLTLYNCQTFNVDMDKNVDFILVKTEATGLGEIVPTPEQPTPDQPGETAEINYAYVLKVGTTGAYTDNPRTALKVYTSNDEYGVLSTAQKVKVNGETFRSEEAYNSVTSGQVIVYETNTSGEITSINTPILVTSTDNVEGAFTEYASAAGILEYNAATGAFVSNAGELYLAEDTIIMVAPTMGYNNVNPEDLAEDDLGLFNLDFLADGQVFENARVYNVGADKKVKFILVQTEVEVAVSGSVMAIAMGIGEIENESGDPVNIIKAAQNGVFKGTGEEVGLITIDEYVTVNTFETFVPEYNINGEVKAVNILADENGIVDVTYMNMANNNPYSYVKYYYGAVTDRVKREYTIGGQSVSISNDTNVYVYYSGAQSKNRVTIEDYSAIDFEDTDRDGLFDAIYFGAEQLSTVHAVAYEYDGDVTDIVIYAIK